LWSHVQAQATTNVSIRPTGAMGNQSFAVQAGGMGGMVQCVFTGAEGQGVRNLGLSCNNCIAEQGQQ
jgi:hypothetical protein